MPIAVKFVWSMLALWPGLFRQPLKASPAEPYPAAIFSPFHVP
jgi:hypothetical protein